MAERWWTGAGDRDTVAIYDIRLKAPITAWNAMVLLLITDRGGGLPWVDVMVDVDPVLVWEAGSCRGSSSHFPWCG